MCALAVLQMARQDPRYLLPCAVILTMMAVPPLLARRRMRQLLLSGDVLRVLGSWQGAIDRVMFPETMAPLMAATAYASYGWVDAAQTALDRAAKGPAWDAAVEQRLFIEVLLDTFHGDRASGVSKAEKLEQLPLPPAGPLARRRVARLRPSKRRYGLEEAPLGGIVDAAPVLGDAVRRGRGRHRRRQPDRSATPARRGAAVARAERVPGVRRRAPRPHHGVTVVSDSV